MTPAHILVAEDSGMLRMMMKKTLEGAGYTVTLAEDGTRAWELIQNERFDLLVLDNRMPGRDGVEISREVKANPDFAGLPVIIVSGDEAPAECGADRYVVKDPGFVGLLHAVEELLGA